MKRHLWKIMITTWDMTMWYNLQWEIWKSRMREFLPGHHSSGPNRQILAHGWGWQDDYQERKIPEAECFDRAEDGVMLRGQENSDDSPSFLAVSYPCQEEQQLQQQFHCWCRETFSTKIDLRNHMENHHKTNRKTKIAISKSKNVENLICTSCDKTFTDQLSYLKHMRFGHK